MTDTSKILTVANRGKYQQVSTRPTIARLFMQSEQALWEAALILAECWYECHQPMNEDAPADQIAQAILKLRGDA